MFENPGKKLKSLSKIMFWLTIIGSFVLALVFGIDRSYWRDELTAYFFVFLIGGSILAYVEGLLLYAFGSLVESAEQVAYALEEDEEEDDSDETLEQ